MKKIPESEKRQDPLFYSPFFSERARRHHHDGLYQPYFGPRPPLALNEDAGSASSEVRPKDPSSSIA
ncbi:hypothetical protein [Alsobacter sp. SYSU BS001988]